MRHISVRALAVIAFASLLASSTGTTLLAADSGKSTDHERGTPAETKVLQPLAKYKGLTSGEWLAAWWQEVFAIAVEGGSHPLIDGGAFGGNNRTLFLNGPVLPAGSPTVTTRITIPSGTHLVIPIITVECSVAEAPPFYGENELELRTCANGLLDEASEPSMRIDGKLVKNADSYRVETPLFRYGPLTADNVLGLPPGTQSDAVGAGYVVVVAPLNPGMHRIRVGASVLAFGIAVDAEFIVTVEPPRKK